MARINYNADINKATELKVDTENSKAFIHIHQCYIFTVKCLPICFPLTLLSCPKELFWASKYLYFNVKCVIVCLCTHQKRWKKQKI